MNDKGVYSNIKRANLYSTRKTNFVNCFVNLKIESLLNKKNRLLTEWNAWTVNQLALTNQNIWKRDLKSTWDLARTVILKRMKLINISGWKIIAFTKIKCGLYELYTLWEILIILVKFLTPFRKYDLLDETRYLV